MRTSNESIEKYSVFTELNQSVPRPVFYTERGGPLDPLVRNCHDAHQLSLRVLPHLWVDQVPVHVGIFLDCHLHPLQAMPLMFFERKLNPRSQALVIERSVFLKARHVVIAYQTLLTPEEEDRDGKTEQIRLLEDALPLTKRLLKETDAAVLDTFRFTSKEVLQGLLSPGTPYFRMLKLQ